jgi:hypothetical protein
MEEALGRRAGGRLGGLHCIALQLPAGQPTNQLASQPSKAHRSCHPHQSPHNCMHLHHHGLTSRSR